MEARYILGFKDTENNIHRIIRDKLEELNYNSSDMLSILSQVKLISKDKIDVSLMEVIAHNIYTRELEIYNGNFSIFGNLFRAYKEKIIDNKYTVFIEIELTDDILITKTASIARTLNNLICYYID